MTDDERADARGSALLLLGVVSGIVLAGLSLVDSSQRPAPPGAVAVVNGEAIGHDAFERFASLRLAPRTLADLEPSARRELLSRMIDEELLVQHGLGLGLGRIDPAARRAVLATLGLVITGSATSVELDDDELRRFYAEHGERFRGPAALVIEAALVRVGPASEAAAHRRAAELVRAAQADPGVLAAAGASDAELRIEHWPAGAALSLDALEKRFGAKARRIAEALEPGRVGPPLRTEGGWLVLSVRDRRAGPALSFEEARDRVRLAVLRERSADAQQRYVEDLRRTAEIRILDPELAGP